MSDRGGEKPSLGESEDRAKATSLLEESLAISIELGMRPVMELVQSRLDILKAG